MYSVLFFSPVFMRHKPLPRQSHLWEIAVALRALQPAAWALIDAFQWTGGNKIHQIMATKAIWSSGVHPCMVTRAFYPLLKKVPIPFTSFQQRQRSSSYELCSPIHFASPVLGDCAVLITMDLMAFEKGVSTQRCAAGSQEAILDIGLAFSGLRWLSPSNEPWLPSPTIKASYFGPDDLFASKTPVGSEHLG